MKFKFYFLKLSIICLIIFIFQQINQGITNFLILNQQAIQGQYWRFLTAIFLHGSLPHLIYNLFALLFFGLILEKTIGSKKFLFIFLTSGIIANIISVNFYLSSLGASGAIYGIIGALTILKPFMLVWAFGLLLPMFIASILWTIGDILGAFGFGNQSIGNIAHLSGIAIGFIFGLFLKSKNSTKKQIKKIPENYIKLWEDRWM